VADLRKGEGGEVDVTVQVRDACWWATLVLILGLTAAFGIEWFLTRWRPRKNLELLVQRAKERATDLQNHKFDELQKYTLGDGTVDRIYLDDDSQPSLLKMAGEAVLQEFRNALSDDERQKWGPNGPEMEKIDGYEASLHQLLDKRVQLTKAIHDFRNELDQSERQAFRLLL
jgi:hypothetical protein